MFLCFSIVKFLLYSLLLCLFVCFFFCQLLYLLVFYVVFLVFFFFFFKQKTAYEMRISDWSSDVCSSDLFSAEIRQQLEERITRICMLQAESFGATAQVDYQRGYPVLVNSSAETQSAIAVARQQFGDEKVVSQIEPLMGSEDFAYMLQERPGCYLLIGNGQIGQHNAATGLTHCMVHNPGYDFNDACLAPAATFWAALVEHRLAPGQPLTPSRN